MNPTEKSLLAFLKDDSIRVATLKGEWGIGKTFFWNTFFNSKKEDLPFRGYSYISLFGLETITDVKRKLFSSFTMLNKKDMSKHFEKLKPLTKFLESIDIPYLKDSSQIAGIIENKILENLIICIDDLERKEASLSASSVLGLISELKEEKRCKILLVYNDKSLDSETAKQINEYREKVVDLDISYCPTIEGNLSIIWPKLCPELVRIVFTTLGLNNIRVMQKVKWTLDYFSNVSKQYPDLKPSFEFSCIVLTVIHHAYGKQLSLEEALSTSYISLFSKDEENPEHSNKFDVIKKLTFSPNDQDVIIAEYLLNGHVELDNYRKLLSEKNEQFQRNDITARHTEIWNLYRSNFSTSQEDFIDQQIAFLSANSKYLKPSDIALTIDFIRNLKPDLDLNHILDDSIDRFCEKTDRLSRRDRDTLRHFPAVIEKIEAKLAERTQNLSVTELFVALAGSDSWDSSNIQHLCKYSEEDFFHWITTEKSVDVIDLLNIFLSRFGDQNASNMQVCARIKAALTTLKARSSFDRLRIEKLIESMGD